MEAGVLYSAPRPAYLPGEAIERDVLAIDGGPLGRLRCIIGASPGSGFAGQVYQAVVEQPGPFPPLVAIKVLRPRSRWKNFSREALFSLCFQSAFAPRLREEAVQAGLLWQTLLRAAAAAEFGHPDAVVRPYGYFWDADLASYAEVHAWVSGRPARCQPDELLLARLLGDSQEPPATEMARMKNFMDALAGLCRRMGALGLARQYDWYTLVSQANVLVLEDGDRAGEPAAVDCRPGLAIPFFLPVSPAHALVILDGLRRGRLAHYDEVDFNRLARYLDNHPALDELRPLARRLVGVDSAYRAGLPDLCHTRTRVLRDAAFRRRIFQAALRDWVRAGLIPDASADSLSARPTACLWLWLLTRLPLVGPALVRLLANPDYRRHLRALLAQPAYRRTAVAAWQRQDLPQWTAEGRVHPDHARWLAVHPRAYAVEKLLPSAWPAALHRLVVDPLARRQAVERLLLQPLGLLFSQPARCRWLEGILQYQFERGIIPAEKAGALLGQISEPRMQGFIRDLGFTAGLDLISRLAYLALGLYGLSSGNFLPLGLALLAPIPPSGPLRFLYVLGRLLGELPAILLRKDPGHPPERLLLARLAALLVSPWRWAGNLFPLIEISAVYTRLAFVLAEYYAARLAGVVPIYGGQGKLLEYWVFQLCFNFPLSLHYLLIRRKAQGPEAGA